jgi:hypothetical protein
LAGAAMIFGNRRHPDGMAKLPLARDYLLI